MIIKLCLLRRNLVTVAACLCSSGFAGGSIARGAGYSVTDLGTLGGPSSTALALNGAGVVVGWSDSSNAPDVKRAFRWENGTMLDLGTLGGPSAIAYDINEAGQITGYAETADSIPFNETFHAFVWQDQAMQDLGTTGGMSSRGYAINAGGVVVGTSQICWVDPKNPGGPCFPVGNEYAAVWIGDKGTDLGGLFGSSDSSAHGINQSNQIVGQSIAVNGASQPRHAVLWQDGQAIDMGTLGGAFSWAFDINDAGFATGYSDNPGNTAHHAFIYDTEALSMVDLGLPPADTFLTNTIGHGINIHNQVVGEAYGKFGSAAFLHDGTSMHDLNELIPAGSGWQLVEALDINDAGWIVGHGFHNGAEHAFLLKPIVCPADIDANGAADIDDLLAVINDWGPCANPSNCPADIVPPGGDDLVNIDDLLAVINAWGPCP